MSTEATTAVTVEGGIFSSSVLQRLARRDSSLPHLTGDSYGLDPGVGLGEGITRSWNRLLAARQKLGGSGNGSSADLRGLVRMLLEELRFGRPPRIGSVTVNGVSYPITNMWENVPIHLLAPEVPLDERSEGVAGAARRSPHNLVQEFLNATDKHLWAIVSNGRLLRILRDNRSITRTPYIEFDLEAIFDGELFSEFALLWLLAHQSRFEAPEPARCILEQWRNEGIQQGERALADLRTGVQEAIALLGEGFLAHPANSGLRTTLKEGVLATQGYYQELLRLVYRLIFLFVAEDRNALLVPETPPEAKKLYLDHYSTRRLRSLAEEIRGTHHRDLYEQFKVLMQLLHRDGSAALALPALGSYLWSPEALSYLGSSALDNQSFLEAIRKLAFTVKGRNRWRTDFRSLGSEELGSVYESLLELRPQLNTDANRFELNSVAGNERKTSGSYYTPHVLVEKLLDTALDPVIEKAAQSENPVETILSLKVVDPATGSGHFLVAAAQRIAKRLAAVRTGEAEPAPDAVRHAEREVINRCIYGVDINPMAVELCKVSLWMEAMEPGKPLSFLDHHIKVGNTLFGTTPELIENGIPDNAFAVLTLDDKAATSAAKKRNKRERAGDRNLFNVADAVRQDLSVTAARLARLNTAAEDNLAEVEAVSTSYEELVSSDSYRRDKLIADTWCAAFVWPKRTGAPEAVTQEYLCRLDSGEEALSADQRRTVEELAVEYRFFHWHLEFPDVFLREDEQQRGFDCVLGNPPWERVKLQEQEWFAQRDPDIASAPNADARKNLIADLTAANPALHDEFLHARRRAEGIAHFLHSGGRYPLCGRGDINTYSVFTEHGRDAAAPAGRTGMVVPSGIASDDTTRHFFADIVEHRHLVSLYDFENKGIFPGVHSSYKFCLLTLSGGDLGKGHHAQFVFFAHDVADLEDTERRIELSREDFLRINPNTRTAPIFRSRRDAEITRRIYERVPVLIDENREDGNPWGIVPKRLLDMNKQSVIRSCSEGRQSPDQLVVYEAKLMHQFDHRYATYTASGEVRKVLSKHPNEVTTAHWYFWPQGLSSVAAITTRPRWLLAWRDIARSTDVHTVISCMLPPAAADFTVRVNVGSTGATRSLVLTALFNSFAFDYVAANKVPSTHVADFVLKQLPVPAPHELYAADLPISCPKRMSLERWVAVRSFELTYTAHDLDDLARDFGSPIQPFRWDHERRFVIRCELDAAFFHVYEIERDDVDYIMEQFPIVRRHDEKAYGSYRTKDTILRYYDRMKDAMDGGPAFESALDPPPGDPAATIDAVQDG